ncbi:MAG: C40 family peptidase [Anaerovoracaceae bacterium]
MHFKRILALVLALTLSFSCVAFADESRSGVSNEFENAAVNLYINGLFKGAADGFELSTSSTKAQAAVMAVRLLGAEDEVISGSYTNNYLDVPEWADSYVGYLVKNEINVANSDKVFGADNNITADDFTVMIMQALGYKEVTIADAPEVVFGYAVQDGILNWKDVELIKSSSFNRGAMAYIANRALDAKFKASEKTLYSHLKDKGAIQEVAEPTDAIKYGTVKSIVKMLNKADEKVSAVTDSSLTSNITGNASKHMGIRYRSAGKSPSTGFDCSGFVGYVMIQSGVWNQFYGSCDGVRSQCTSVSKEEARPGDIVFFKGTYRSSHNYTHVGIYLGNNQMIHSSSSDGVSVSSIASGYWASHYSGIARPNVMM